MSRMIRFRSAVYLTVGIGFSLAASGMISAQQSEVSQVGWWRSPGPVPAYVSGAAPAAGQPTLAQPAPSETTPPTSALACGVGCADEPLCVPNMIGDLPGIRPMITVSGFTFSNPVAAGAGFFKISDNEYVLPTDRVFFNFNQYQNALDFDGTGHNLTTYAFGVEKTLFGGICSVEARIPFATGFAAVESTAGGTAVEGTEFGNVPIVFKTLLYNGERNIFSGGVAVTLPTARDVNIDSGALAIENGSVHLQPFLMWLWQPRGRLFFMGFAGVDFDTGVNDVFAGGTFVGRYHEQALMFLDGKLGYWLYQNSGRRWLTGILPTVEIHYTSTMQDAPTVTNIAGTGVTPVTLRQDILDLTAGLQILLGRSSDLTFACALPLRTDTGDRLFDTEFLVQFNRRF